MTPSHELKAPAASGTTLTSTSVGYEAITPDDDALLASLQGQPIHAAPGRRPVRTGTRQMTKTQLAVIHKDEKAVKAKAAEDKKLAIATRKIEKETKKQERAIATAETRAAKAVAKADQICLKLAKATKG